MEYFLNEFMHSHTHKSNKVPIFLFFVIKGEENEGDSMAKDE
jgi:hypothetical protein